MMKKIFLVVLCVLIPLVISYFVAVKKRIDLFENEKTISVKLPPILILGIFRNYEINVSSQENNCYLNMLFNSFDRPLLFLPDKNSDAIFVMYFFDIEDHVFAIEKDKSLTTANLNEMHDSLGRIILSSKGFNIRPLTELEVNDIIDQIGVMSEAQYRNFSVPSLDLGLYKLYMPKSKVLEMLQGK